MPVATDRLTAGENLFPLPSEPCLQRALNSFGVALARSNPSLLAVQLAKPAARRRGSAHFLHEIPPVQRAVPRRGVLQHALARICPIPSVGLGRLRIGCVAVD